MAAFEQLYRAHAPVLMARIIAPRVRGEADREDVLVETFQSALEQLGRFRWMGRSFFSWLARIAKNKAVDLARRGARRGRAMERYSGEPVAGHPDGPDLMVIARHDQVRLRAQIERTLDDLNPRYRRAVQLRLVDGRERQACAELMDVRLGTFDVVLLRAVRAFRKRWVERYGEETV